MINFASLFNQFRSNSNSVINQLLDQPNPVDIARLLDEDTCVNEYKSGNSKLTEYMKYDKYESLIEYITVVGPPQDRRRSYKFPFSASQILSFENSTIADFFFPESQLYIQIVQEQEEQVEQEVDDDSPSQGEKSPEKQLQPAPQEDKVVIQDKLQGNNKASDQQTPDKTADKPAEQAPAEKSEQNSTKKKKIIKVMKPVKKTIKKEVPPLIGKLFNYFDGEVNYILAGYVCKVLGTLLNKKPSATIKYILEPENRTKLLNHIQSKSVSEFIVKIFTHQSTQSLKQRGDYYREVIGKNSKQDQIFVLSNASACIIQTIEKVVANLKGNNAIKQFGTIYFNPQDITTIINNVMSSEENVSVYNSPILLCYLLNIPLTAPESSQILQKFGSILQDFVDKACKKLTVTRQSRKVLGFGRVKIIQIFTFILKENILNARDLIAKKESFFQILFDLCKNYPMNNILHNQFVKIVELALSQNSDSDFLRSLIGENLLLNFIAAQYEDDRKIVAGQSESKARKGYIGHIVQICQKIKEYSSNNKLLNEFIQTQKFQQINKNLIEKQTFQAKKNLAGYSMRKGQPQKILFQKEDVLAEYVTFLNKPTIEVFENDDPIDIPAPDLKVDQMMKQLQALNVSKPQEASNKTSQEIQEEKQLAEHANPKYWVKHMDYDIEELISQLI